MGIRTKSTSGRGEALRPATRLLLRRLLGCTYGAIKDVHKTGGKIPSLRNLELMDVGGCREKSTERR